MVARERFRLKHGLLLDVEIFLKHFAMHVLGGLTGFPLRCSSCATSTLDRGHLPLKPTLKRLFCLFGLLLLFLGAGRRIGLGLFLVDPAAFVDISPWIGRLLGPCLANVHCETRHAQVLPLKELCKIHHVRFFLDRMGILCHHWGEKTWLGGHWSRFLCHWVQ